jgi:hypothetical protein
VRGKVAVKLAGGRVRFVEPTCPIDEIERRMGSGSRAEFGKLRSFELFRELRQGRAFEYRRLPDSGLSLDTSRTSLGEAAHRIREFFSLQKEEA